MLTALLVATAADKMDTVFNLLDGISCSDATNLQRAFCVSNQHPFTCILREASECDKMYNVIRSF